jgi:3'-5' exoribonuclease
VSLKTEESRRPKRLSDLVPGMNVGPFRVAVSAAEIKTTKNGNPYLEVALNDRSGSQRAKCWDGAPRIADFAEGTALEIKALNHDPAFGPKFELNDYRVLGEGEYAPQEFVAALPAEHVERLWKEFHGFLDSIRNPHLQRLRKAIWGDEALAAKYKWHPSAVGHHHNFLGGNIQHVVGIMRVVEAVATSYPEIDRDLVVFGAAIHDLGKLQEYEVATTIRVTSIGKLQGHLVIGARWIGELIAAIRANGEEFPQNLEDHLVHMILSHHGKGEWGSPKPPATPEAMLLHLGDYADSQTKGFLQFVEENRSAPGGWARRWDRDIGENRNVRIRWDDEV